MKFCLFTLVILVINFVSYSSSAHLVRSHFHKVIPSLRVTHLRYVQVPRGIKVNKGSYVDETGAIDQNPPEINNNDGYLVPYPNDDAGIGSENQNPDDESIIDVGVQQQLPNDEPNFVSEVIPSTLDVARAPATVTYRSRPTFNRQQSAGGSYFPIGFGEAPAGSIAIANSYGTGRLGHVASHATAYGSGP